MPTVILGTAALIICAALTHYQLQSWRNGVTLWQRAVTVDPNNYFAHSYLANELALHGQAAKAVEHYRAATRINPRYVRAHVNLSDLLAQTGDVEGADLERAEAIKASLTWQPDDPELLAQLGDFFVQQAKYDEAVTILSKAVQLKPDSGMAHRNLGAALIELSRKDEALAHCTEAVRLMPKDAKAHLHLGSALALNGQVEQAISQFRNALELDPNNADSMNGLAWILAIASDPKFHNPTEAVALASRACQLTRGENPGFLDTLAVAEAAVGHFDDAIRLTKRIRDSARAAGQIEFAQAAEKRLALFEQHRPYNPAAEK